MRCGMGREGVHLCSVQYSLTCDSSASSTLHPPGLPGPCVHDDDSVRVEPEEPVHQDELLWHSQLSGTLPSLGAVWVFPTAGKFPSH